MKRRVLVALMACLVFCLFIGLTAGCSPQEDILPGEDVGSDITNGDESGNSNGNGIEIEEGGDEGNNDTNGGTGETQNNESPFPDGLALPQVYILGSLYYTQADLNALQTNVIEPIVEHYAAMGQTVVSFYIDDDNRGESVKNSFTISVIISKNDGSHEPIYMGFIHDKVNGQIPVWEEITMD